VNSFKVVNNIDVNRLIKSKISFDEKFLYYYEENEHENSKTYVPEISIYKKYVNNAEKIYVETVSGFDNTVFNSSHFHYLFYFKGKDWFRYDPLENKHINITKKSGGMFYDKEKMYYLMSDDPVSPQFSVLQKKWVVFRDYYDVWFYDVTHNKIKRITEGEKEGRVY